MEQFHDFMILGLEQFVTKLIIGSSFLNGYSHKRTWVMLKAIKKGRFGLFSAMRTVFVMVTS